MMIGVIVDLDRAREFMLGKRERPRGSVFVVVLVIGAMLGLTACGDVLLHRRLHLPELAPGGGCPTTRRTSQPTPTLGVLLGDGPVRPAGIPNGVLVYVSPTAALPSGDTNVFAGSAWGGNKVLWAVGPTVRSDVLIRGHQIDGPGQLRFGLAHNPDTEMILPSRSAGAGRYATGWRGFPSETRIQHRGCYAYQIDTVSTSTIVVFSAR